MNAATNAQRTVIPVVVPGAPRHTATTGLVASSSSSSSSKHHPYPYPVAAGAGEVTHPTAKNKAEHHTLCPPADTSLGGTVHCLAVSPKDPDLRVVPASNNNKKTMTMKGGDANSSSSDRRRRALVVMYRGSVVARLERHREQVEALAFSEDGRWLASGDAGGVVAVWRVDPRPAASPHTSVSFAYQLPLGGASPSPSSSILALAFTSAHLVVSHAHLSVYPIPTATATATATREQQQQQNEEEEDAREVVHHAPLPWSDLRATALAWAGALGNHIVACRRDAVCLYTLPGLELVASWTESSSKRRRIAGVAVSESGIIAVATGHTVQLLRYTNHVLVPAALLSDHASDVYSVAFSAANPSVLASGSADMTVRVWEVLDGRGAAARCTRLISNTRAGVRCVNLSGPPDRCCSQRLTFATSKAAIFQVQLQLTDDSPRTPPSDSSSSCPSPCPSLDWASDIAGEVEEEEEEEEEDQAEHRAPPLPPPGAAANQQPVDEDDDDDDVVFLGTRSSDSGERPEAGRPPSSATQLRQRQRDTDEPCSAPRRRRLGEGASTALFVPIRPGPQVAVVSPRPRPLPLPLPEEPPQLVGQWRAGATGMPTAAAATAVAAAPALSRRYFHASPQSVGVGGPVFQPPAGQLRTGLLLAALQAVPAECGVMALYSRLRHQLLGKSEAASAAALLTVSHKGFTESPMHQLSEALVRQDRALVEKWRPLVELAMQGLQQCEQCTPGIRPLLRAGQRLPSGYTVGDSLTFPGFAPLFRAKPDGLLPFCESARSARLPTVFRIQAPSARVPRNMDAHSDAFLAPGTVLRVVSVDVRTGVVDLQEVVTESP